MTLEAVSAVRYSLVESHFCLMYHILTDHNTYILILEKTPKHDNYKEPAVSP